MATTRAGWLILRAGRQIWFRAAAISAAGVLVAASAGPLARLIPYHFTGDIGQNSVDTVLQIIASSMLAVTTFSLTAMVSAYSSATQLATPRATQLLISDRTSQNALSTFLGAFVFAVVGVIGLQTELYGGQGRVVLLIATVALIALVVVTLLRWIGHLASFGRMADVIDRVEDAACAAVSAYARDPHGGGRPPVPVPPHAWALAPDRIGYVTHVDVEALGKAARRHGLICHVEALPGTLVHAARPLMHVQGPPPDDEGRAALVKAFTVERHRNFDHDPRLGLIALAEIAGRALSPATNDPGTAVEVLNALLRTLSRLSEAPDPCGEDRPPVHVPSEPGEALMRDGFVAIVRDGAGEEEVAMRAFKVLAAIGTTVPALADVARTLAEELRANVERVMEDPAARARALSADGAAG